jgi:hypothetical protein
MADEENTTEEIEETETEAPELTHSQSVKADVEAAFDAAEESDNDRPRDEHGRFAPKT